MLPSVRRVYVDAAQQAKLVRAEARVKVLERDKEILMGECERHMAASRAHAEGEREAKQELEEKRAAMVEVRARMAEMGRKIEAFEESMRRGASLETGYGCVFYIILLLC
jgi:hypothetical protein